MIVSHRGQAGTALAVLTAAVTVGVAPQGAADTAPRGQASRAAVITGAGSINETEARYQIKGTDLGIMWTDERGLLLAAFGDTFGAGWAGHGSGVGDPAAIDWRAKTLARSFFPHPADGTLFDKFVTPR